jgi:hypothetical protein
MDQDMCWHGRASGKRGRRPRYSEAVIQFCLTIKGLFNLALRQAMGMAQSLLKASVQFSTVSLRQKHLAVTIAAHPTTTGLHLLVDSMHIAPNNRRSRRRSNHCIRLACKCRPSADDRRTSLRPTVARWMRHHHLHRTRRMGA